MYASDVPIVGEFPSQHTLYESAGFEHCTFFMHSVFHTLSTCHLLALSCIPQYRFRTPFLPALRGSGNQLLRACIYRQCCSSRSESAVNCDERLLSSRHHFLFRSAYLQ